MREYPFKFHIANGLQPTAEATILDSGFLHTAKNVRINTLGARAIALQPFIDIFQVWPFPTIFVDEGAGLYFGAARAPQKLDPITLAVSACTPYDCTNPAATLALADGYGAYGYAPCFAAFRNWWVYGNGAELLWLLPHNEDGKVYCANDSFSIVGKWNTNLLLAGPTSGLWNYLTADEDFLTIFSTWLKTVNDDSITSYDFLNDADNYKQLILFGSQGGNSWDWPHALLPCVAKLCTDALFTKLKSTILDQIKAGHIGFAVAPDAGNILAIRQLGKRLLIYGAHGIFELSNTRSEETLAARRVSDLILASPGAVGGDVNTHFFVNRDCDLYTVKDDLAFSRLGFKNHLSWAGTCTVGVEPRLVFDPFEQELFLGNGSVSYLLSQGRLTSTDYFVTSGVRAGTPASAVATPAGTGFAVCVNSSLNAEMELETLPTDMGNRGLKQLRWIELDCEGVTGLQVACSYRSGQNDSFISSPWVYGSPDGRFFVGITACDFRIKVKGTLTAVSQIRGLLGRFVYADNRTVRGPRGGLDQVSGVQTSA